MDPTKCGLVYLEKGKKKKLQYFTDWEILAETLYGKKVGEFVRVLLPDGTLIDIHDKYGSDRVIPAIEMIKRFPA